MMRSFRSVLPVIPVGDPRERKFELAKPVTALPVGRRPAVERLYDDDEKQQRRDDELRRLEDRGEDTGEDEDEKKARHAREAKRAKNAEGDDGNDESDRDDEEDAGMRAARRHERGRIAAIMSSAAARKYPVLAMHIAVETAKPRTQAIAFIQELGALMAISEEAPTLAEQILLAGRRARGEVATPVQFPARERGHAATAREIIAAGKKRRGEV